MVASRLQKTAPTPKLLGSLKVRIDPFLTEDTNKFVDHTLIMELQDFSLIIGTAPLTLEEDTKRLNSLIEGVEGKDVETVDTLLGVLCNFKQPAKQIVDSARAIYEMGMSRWKASQELETATM